MSMNARVQQRLSNRERDHNYRAVIHEHGHWRIILCRDGIQWIVQKLRNAGGRDGGRWEGRRYCTTRKSLVRDWSHLTGEDAARLAAIMPELASEYTAGARIGDDLGPDPRPSSVWIEEPKQ